MRRRTQIIVVICCAAAVAGGVALAANWRSDHELPDASCGSAVTHGLNDNTNILTAGPNTLGCFDAAARDCTSASIEVTDMGVDTGTDYVFRIEPGGPVCHALELSQFYSANFGGSKGQVNSRTCDGLAVTDRGVTLSCGGQVVFIPATIDGQPTTGGNTPSGPELPTASCGSAATFRIDGETRILTAGPHTLDCFEAAARACTSASIEVVERGVDTGTNHVFTIEPGGTACQVVELSQYYSANFGGSTGPVDSATCVGVAVTSRGVTFSCGGQEVLIPAAIGSQPTT
jgi:hypothetical protein